MNLLYITWGKGMGNHMQTIFAIITAFRYRESFKNIYIVTDHPEYYSFLKDSVQIINVTEETLERWAGPENFILNIKIKGLELFNELYPQENVFFTDSDTFFYESPHLINDLLSQGKAAMQLNEGTFGDRLTKSKTTQRLLPILESLPIEKLKLKRTITKDTQMYNSGVIALPAHNMKQILAQVSDLTTYFLSIKGLRIHYLEQLAFSLVIEDNYELHDCEYCVGHYWGNKEEWQENISTFLIKGFSANYGIDDFVQALSDFNFDLPIIVRKRSMNKKLKQKVDKLIPNKYTYLKRK